MTTPGGSAPDGAYVIGTRFGSDETEAGIRNKLKTPVGGFAQGQNNLWGSGGFLGMIVGAFTGGSFFDLGGASTYADSQQAIINDHTASIEALQAQVEALVLQGLAIKFVGNSTYYPSDGVVSVEVIIIGAGGGGGAGSWNLLAGVRHGGAGGGGGGEIHARIPANLLPSSVTITIGAGGAGGSVSGGAGTGGGNTLFDTYLTAGGGVGGSPGSLTVGVGGSGGAGMITGGQGGSTGQTADSDSGRPAVNATVGGTSASSFDLYGGGGGGGAGARSVTAQRFPTPGGGGVASLGGQPGFDAPLPSSILAVGGGGGGGAITDGETGHAGAFPAGGGGGGAGGANSSSFGPGGPGGNGVIYVIERFL